MKKAKIMAFVATVLLAFAACDEVKEEDRLIYVKPAEAARCIVIEDFTGQRCVNCPAASAMIETLQEQYGADTVIAVGIHSGPFGKNARGQLLSLATETGDAYYNHWGIDAQPGAMINRGAPIYDPSEYASKVSEALSKTTPVTLKVDRQYDEATRKLTVTVTGMTAEDVDTKLQLWLTENNIVDIQLFPNNVTDREYVHNHVFRTSLTADIYGDEFRLAALQGEREVTYTTTLDEKWDAGNMHIVAFVYDNSGILQACRKPVGSTLEDLYANYMTQ